MIWLPPWRRKACDISETLGRALHTDFEARTLDTCTVQDLFQRTQRLNQDLFFKPVAVKKELSRTAKERRPGALGYSEAMMLAYNAKNKYRLSLRVLYGEKVPSSAADEEE